LLIVGIAHTMDELIRCHPSLRRHLVPIPIGRISREDTYALIDTGARRARVSFDEESKAEIASISCGSPYHVQLFCYVAAIEAVRRDTDVVNLTTTRVGLRRACNTWGMLNAEDLELFQALATAEAQTVRLVECAARSAAVQDYVHTDERTASLLGAALRRDEQREGCYYFRDGAAPQFLLALISLQRAEDSTVSDITALSGSGLSGSNLSGSSGAPSIRRMP
jgi:hypothetical protein